MMTTLKALKMYPGELFIQHGAGPYVYNVEWKRRLEDLRGLVVPESSAFPCWDEVPVSTDILKCLLPVDKLLADFRLLFAYKGTQENGKHFYKGAVQHCITGYVANLTSFNSIPAQKYTDSHVFGYYTIKADMTAFPFYWNRFKTI